VEVPRGAESLIAAHRGRRYPFLLDAGRSARPSYAGSDPTRQLVVTRDGRSLQWDGRDWRFVDAGDPIDAIGRFIEESEADSYQSRTDWSDGARVPARTVGYLAYELGAHIESVPAVAADRVGAPLAVLSTYSRIDAIDPASGIATTIEFHDSRVRKSDQPVPARPVPVSPSIGEEPDELDLRACYRAGFARIIEAIRAGEIYQANLTRRLRRPFADDPLACYFRLRARQPVPYGAYLDLGSLQILSNSPESFLSIDRDWIETRPIKGTRGRGADPAEDRAAVSSLLSDPKELAEHVMIVDLERNDLGRVCTVGSVEVAEHARVISLATLHHLESRVRGHLRSRVSTADVLRATFPGGSVTGAPKIQAMHIIAEVEPSARGVYTGAIGAFNGARRAELNLAIRTAVVAGGYVTYGTGGGIVADSRADAEYEETVTKSRAFLDSLTVQDNVGGRAGST
jgi:para-aminobenzoate synthetase component 1